jgi:hypothetical protein
VIRDEVAFMRSREKEQEALNKRIAIARAHLTRIIAEKHNGTLRATSRENMRDILIRDGVLGARWNAKHIANAKKYDKPLNQWEQKTAETIVDRALSAAEVDGKVTVSSSERSFKIRLEGFVSEPTILADLEAAHALDVDDKYPLSSTLPRYRASAWDLRYAHE